MINVSDIIGLLILLADVDVQLNYQKLLVLVFRFFMTKHAHIKHQTYELLLFSHKMANYKGYNVQCTSVVDKKANIKTP